jgi:hypothetical protein
VVGGPRCKKLCHRKLYSFFLQNCLAVVEEKLGGVGRGGGGCSGRSVLCHS